MRLAVLLAALPLLIVPALAGSAAGTLQVGVTIGLRNAGGAAQAPGVRYTWGAAAISVTAAGFERPQRLSAAGNVYWFSASRDGWSYRVAVSAATGQVIAAERS